MVTACAALALTFLASAAQAAVAPSRGRTETQRDKNLRRVRRLLQEKQVRKELARVGMRREEIEKRLERMDDEELQHLADRLDSLAIGRGAAGVVIVVLVVVALVLLIVWLAQRV
jgi:Flp pilus assembly protein TadB